MGYKILPSDKAKPALVKMELKEPKKLVTQKPHLAKILVDLVLFDFELSTLEECIYEYRFKFPGRNCNIMEAWEARKNTIGGVDSVLGYLRSKCAATVDTKRPVNPSSVSRSANDRHANIIPGSNVTEEKPLDIKALPPPDHGEGEEFASVTQHINPSSHYDDDDNQLIKDSTLLGYRNPPEAKSQVKPSNLQPMADPTGYPPGGYRSPEWVTPTTSLPSEHAVPSPNRDDKFDHTRFEVSRQGQHQHVDARRMGNELGYGNTRPPNMTPAAAIPGDTAKAGGLHSLPSVTVSTSANANQFGSSPRTYKRHASIPNDGSLSGGSERMAAISTGTTTNSNQLGVSDSSGVLIAAVPIIDQPTPEVSQAPPDSKYGKTNLPLLKNRLQHKKEVTQTVFQTGGAGTHSQTPSSYVNMEIPYQGVSDNTTKPVAGKTDLASLRNKLEKSKEVREKAEVAGSVSKNAGDYYNMAEISSYIPENPVTIKNPYDKRPVVNPRTVTPANLASSNTHSGSSTSSKTYQLWQCARCQNINEAHHASCNRCKLPYGKMANRSYFCHFCRMMIFIPQIRRDFKDTSCPRCKQVYETVL